MSLIAHSLLFAGSYLIAEVSDVETSAGDKVRGEVVAVVYDAHVRQMRKEGQWCVRARALAAAAAVARAVARGVWRALRCRRCCCVPARELLALGATRVLSRACASCVAQAGCVRRGCAGRGGGGGGSSGGRGSSSSGSSSRRTQSSSA
jgi:hypothetical protein